MRRPSLRPASRRPGAALKVGDPKAICWGHYDVGDSLSRAGRLDDAAEKVSDALGKLGWNSGTSPKPILGGTRGFFLLQSSRPELARQVLAEAWEITRSKWNFIEYSLRCLPLLLESIVGHDWLQHAAEGGSSRSPTTGAVEPACCIEVFPYCNQQCSAHWEGSLLHKAKLAKRSAISVARLHSAERQKMPFYLAKSLLDLAAVDPTDRDAHRQRAVELLKEMESVIPRAESWLLGDQYDEAVVAPEFDLEAWEAEHGVISRPAREEPE